LGVTEAWVFAENGQQLGHANDFLAQSWSIIFSMPAVQQAYCTGWDKAVIVPGCTGCAPETIRVYAEMVLYF
jgi:hypothetical protein